MSPTRVFSVACYTIAGAMAVGLIRPADGLPVQVAVLCFVAIMGVGWWVGRKG